MNTENNYRRKDSIDDIKEILNASRRFAEENRRRERKILREEGKEERQAIPITDDPRFGDNVLQNQINEFRQVVHPGAQFSSDTENPKNSPLVYFPDTANIVFSGTIPPLADLKFQFSLNDVTNAPYIFVEGLAITKDVITVLNKLSGYYLNWKDSWYSGSDMLTWLKNEEQ